MSRIVSYRRAESRRRSVACWALLLVWGAAVGVGQALLEAPLAVSPGATRGAGIVIADICPTFSWGEVKGASSYELTVYRLGNNDLEPQRLFTERIGATALSWTPSLARCLEPGGRYAWSLRAVGASAASKWSEPSLFQVVAESEGERDGGRSRLGALAVEESTGLADKAAEAAQDGAGGEEASPQAAGRAALPGTQLDVSGNVNASSFSGDGSMLTGLAPANLAAGTGAIDISGNAATATSAAGADTVDGFDASALATANTLLALDGAGKLPADITGNAATATALAADGTNCAADQAAGGVDASGNAEECRDQADLTAFATRNTRVGTQALGSNTTGSENTASGYKALGANTSGYLNTAVGAESLGANTDGNFNTAAGFRALTTNTSGIRNTADGEGSLELNTTGSRNTAAGSAALRNNTTGDRNLALGYKAGYGATTGSDNVFIANDGVAGDSAVIKIGTQGTQARTYVAGIYGTPLSGASVVVTGTGQLGVASGATGDADTIDGFHAAAAAAANTLLALDGTGKLPADITGNAATATSATSAATATVLTADGADCAVGSGAGGVSASGAAQGCTDYVDVAGDTMTGGLTISAAAGLTLQNGETITNATDEIVRFSDGTDTFDIDLSGSTSLASSASLALTSGGDGTDVSVAAAAATSTNGDGGDIHLNPGAGDGVGADGKVSIGGDAVVSGGVTATSFSGSGTGLTGVNADTAATATSATSAVTAAALAADGANCPSGEAPLGVGAGGDAQGCFDVATQAELDAVAAHTHAGSLVRIYRTQIFGHAAHSAFSVGSTAYASVPGTFSARSGSFPAAAAGTTRRYRMEVSFAVDHDRTITLRMHDPANNSTSWEHAFTGGHASSAWWSWGETVMGSGDPWPRQQELQMKGSDTNTAYLGAVWLVAEDVVQ